MHTRALATIVAVALLPTLLLTACGGGDSGTAGRAGTAGTAGTPVTDTGIWALDESTAMHLLALGVVPTHAARNEYQGDQMVEANHRILAEAGVELVEPDKIELVAAAGPSLIVGVDHYDERLDELEQIAPVVLYDDNGPWDERLELLGAATGHEAEAADLVDRLDGAIDGTKEQVEASGHAGATVSLISACGGGQLCVYDSVRMSGAILDRLGLERPANQSRPGNEYGFTTVSRERVGEYVADIVIVYTGSVAFGAPSPLGDPLFDTSGSVTGEVDFGAWFGADPLSLLWILHDVEAILLGDGEIATAADAPALWAEVLAPT